MDRAPILCSQFAQDKAYSARRFGGLPTGDWWRLLESEPALLHGITKTDRLSCSAAGFPSWPKGGPSAGSACPGGRPNRTCR